MPSPAAFRAPRNPIRTGRSARGGRRPSPAGLDQPHHDARPTAARWTRGRHSPAGRHEREPVPRQAGRHGQPLLVRPDYRGRLTTGDDSLREIPRGCATEGRDRGLGHPYCHRRWPPLRFRQSLLVGLQRLRASTGPDEQPGLPWRPCADTGGVDGSWPSLRGPGRS